MMLKERIPPELSEFLRYLATHEEVEHGLPTLKNLSVELGVSVASLREQLEVARANSNRAAMQSLANESIEYAKRNPALVPVLQALGLRSRIETNQPTASTR